ncbi:UNVERIFIED_CONTAM: hypothetical protein PYX00_000070 [Menopon gallinae]|uniref:RNA helicase n=1 Tax=Menopon gallinae TaxID=328185 RepID=A0AAW2I8E3_9NEOP
MAVDIEGFTTTSNEVCETSKKSAKKSGGFQSFGLSQTILKGIKARGYKVPTPIQRKCIPLILSGQDVVAMARTGSGKTACFLLPMFEKLGKPAVKLTSGPRALIFSPTRELALQTLKFIKDLGRFTKIKAISALGGDSIEYQFGAIHENPDVIVATPGRFLHICLEMNLKLSSVEYVVFDEADRLFELGLGEQLQEILYRLPESKQTLLFSATLPKLLVDFAKAGLSSPVLLRLDVESKLPKTLELAFLSVRPEEKTAALLCTLQALPQNKLTMVFTATKHHVDYLHSILDEAGISNTFLYSDLAPTARKINAAKFQNGNCSVMVVTDVAARGVDIPQLDYVINYHFPSKPKLFIHRVGRCARAGRSGVAVSLISKSEAPYFLDLITFLGRPLNLIPLDSSEKTSKDGAFGKIPEHLIEAEQSRLITWHAKNVELDSMKKVYENGYKKYLQSNPGASKESLKRVKNTNLIDVGIHPFFSADSAADKVETMEFLHQVKKYKPKDTIFELKSSMNQKCYDIMKKTKEFHANSVNKFRNGQQEKEADENVGDETVRGKRKGPSQDILMAHKNKKPAVGEYYVPYSAHDQETENGLSINNFLSEASKATFDITGDCEQGLNVQKRIRKWDKEKKKYVTLKGEEKAGKIKLECGKWVDSSYKSGRYEKWKERSKVQEMEEDSEDDGKTTNKAFPNTHWGRHNRKIAEKLKAKAGLKKPERILKERKELEKKRQKSIPKSKRKNFSKPNMKSNVRKRRK